MKYYAVRIGRNPGIYTEWAQAKAQVDGVSRPLYKSFATLEAAQQFLDAPLRSLLPKPKGQEPAPAKPSLHRPVPTERASAYLAEFHIASAYSVKTGRSAWALLCDADLPQSQKYGGPPPEQKDRAVLCAVLRLLTRANLEPQLKNKPIALHLGSPNWPIYQALNYWIKIWTKKKWNDNTVPNQDLYQLIWPLLKTTNIAFRFHEPRHGIVLQLERAQALALETAEKDE